MKNKISIKFAFVFVLTLQFVTGHTQPGPGKPQLTDGSNFKTIQKELNDFYAANPTAKGQNQWRRKEWFLEPRLYPGNQMENLTLKTWHVYDQYMQTQANTRSTHGNWAFLGASQCSQGLGRLNSIAFDPTDANVMYVGGSNGGVWKTITGGITWSNITPNIPLLAIADIKISPTNHEVIYILTGDGDPDPDENSAHSQHEISSIGILRSTDSGASWYPTNFSFDHPSVLVPVKLLIHPTNPNIQFVASQDGLYRTTNHWATWEITLNQLTYDVEFQPGDPDIMYVGSDNQIYKSTDGGDDWTLVTDPDFSSNMIDATRVELAVAPNNSNVVYALAGNWDEFQAFFESQSEGSTNTWTLRNSSASTLGKFADYCIALAVDPNDWTDVFGGMQWINKSTNQGLTWTSIVNDFVHADIHDVAFANGALWVCCDGGLYKSTNEGASWSELISGLGITEVYRIAGTPQDANLYFVGCQDNGTMRRPGGTSTFQHVSGGDGTTCLIDYTDIDVVYASSQYGNFLKSTSGGDNGSFADLEVPGGDGAWISPMIMDKTNHERLFAGTTDIYRSINGGDTWVDLNAPGGLLLLNCLAQGVSNPNRLYASSGSYIVRCDNAIAAADTWAILGDDLIDLFITGIAVDPNNSSRVFISLSGYWGGEKVYRSTNQGADWVNISGSLPNVPVNCIQFHENGDNNDALYIGTDIGVFYRDNSLGDWIYFSNGMGVSIVNDLYINEASNTITAGTFGRGLWRSDLYTGCIANITLNAFSPNGGVKYYSATNSITSSRNYRNDIGTEIHYSAASEITLITDFEAGGEGYFHGRLAACPDNVIEPFVSPFNSTSVLVMNGFKFKEKK